MTKDIEDLEVKLNSAFGIKIDFNLNENIKKYRVLIDYYVRYKNEIPILRSSKLYKSMTSIEKNITEHFGLTDCIVDVNGIVIPSDFNEFEKRSDNIGLYTTALQYGFGDFPKLNLDNFPEFKESGKNNYQNYPHHTITDIPEMTNLINELGENIEDYLEKLKSGEEKLDVSIYNVECVNQINLSNIKDSDISVVADQLASCSESLASSDIKFGDEKASSDTTGKTKTTNNSTNIYIVGGVLLGSALISLLI